MPALLPDRFLQPDHTLLICTGRTEPVARRLQRLIPHSRVELTDAYDLAVILAALDKLLPASEPTIVNLTGGTKMMMLAAFALAMQRGWNFVYLESEHSPHVLHRYSLTRGHLRRTSSKELPVVIKGADYLNAHLPGFRSEGFSRDERGRLTIGGKFEQAVANALTSSFEVLAGVRPEGVANQIEIDLVIRLGNRVGIAEVKLGGEGERQKHGIDQLATAGGRVYLGTYTAKFLITATRPAPEILALARERAVTVITLGRYQDGFPVEPAEQKRLTEAIKAALSD
jgi:hypothetical protein